MNALIRQVVVLAVLWAVCELLLPTGNLQQMVRMTVSALVLTALISTAAQALHSFSPMPPLMQQATVATSATYQQTVLRSAANQLANYCRRLASSGGYEADVMVWLTEEGGIDSIELSLMESQPLIKPNALAEIIAAQLDISRQQIHLAENGMDAS